MKTLTVILMLLTLSACGQTIARTFGGTTEVTLPEGRRVVTCSWKDGDDLWILTKDGTDTPQTYHYVESSALGVLEGEVIIRER